MIDFTAIRTYPVATRKCKFDLSEMLPVTCTTKYQNAAITTLAQRIRNARNDGHPVMVMMGGAVIKEGCSLLLIDLMKKGLITHLAMNGSVSIHDFEIAMIGRTSEDVIENLSDGSFGMADETGRFMNEAIIKGYSDGMGFGESIARETEQRQFPFREYSIIHQAISMNLRATVHVAIGNDIIHQHPSCDGAATGAASFTDFRLFTDTLSTIGTGVVINLGSAVIMPEVFLKALAICRNLGHRHNDFTVANCDFLDMYRPRTRVLEWPASFGATALNIRGRHRETVAALHLALRN